MAKDVVIIQQTTQTQQERKRVAAYARVSCGKDTMLHSLAAQIDYYRKLILNNPTWKFAGVFADEAKTGTKEDRAEFQALIAECRVGAIDIVITKSISRFARNTVTLLKYVRELKELGIDVFFEEQNIHTLSSEGELMLTLLASFAQEESLSVSENCKWRIRNGFLEGKTTSFRMLGYKVVNGELIVVPEEVATVKRIFDMYLAGYGIQTIANTLTAEGYPTVFGGDWHPYKVGAILDNEKYCGDLILQKTYRNNHIEKKKLRNTGQLQQVFIEDDHEAIIKKDVFRTVAEKRQRRSTNKGVRRECTALTGMIRCPYCGKNYRRKSAARCIKWCCATFNTKGKKFCPESKMIPEDTVIEAVCAVLNMDEYDEREFLDCVDHIDACKGNTLRFYFTDGSTQDYLWADRSRAESWTPEMRESARIHSLRRLTDGRKENNSNSTDKAASFG
ncbi:MAG: recombinase family protein [Ruminococcus sp.]|nr:recombinase family protein [Ruminococcus sp.]